MTMTFWLDSEEKNVGQAAQLNYLPYGTRILRVRVQTDHDLPPLRIRPRRILPADRAAGNFRGFEDDATQAHTAAFEISWGGGHEEGPCTKSQDFLKAFEKCAEMRAGEAQTILFQVTHISQTVPESAQLTLEAFNPDSDAVQATLPIVLRKPAGTPTTIQRMEQTATGRWQVSAGTHLPVYIPRWWPEEELAYIQSPPPPLTIIHNNTANTLEACWEDLHIAIIEDHTRPSILSETGVRFDLYDFDEYYYALRIWFFWLNVNIGHGFFIGRHEVPDSERFDLLIRKKDGIVGLACTDLHWREVWGLATERPVRATLGLSRETKIALAKEQLSGLWGSVWSKSAKSREAERVYNPMEYVSRLARREARSAQPMVVRNKGTEAHLPMLQNVDSSNEKLTSSDVRLG